MTSNIITTSRRRFLAAAAGLGAACAAGPATACSAAATATRGAPAARTLTEVVLEAFKTHRLVGIGEAHHLQNHHDVLDALLTDPRLPEVADDIVQLPGPGLLVRTQAARRPARQPGGHRRLPDGTPRAVPATQPPAHGRMRPGGWLLCSFIPI